MSAATAVHSEESGVVMLTVEAGAYVALTTGEEFTGQPEQTVYLEPHEARQLANALLNAAAEVDS